MKVHFRKVGELSQELLVDCQGLVGHSFPL